MEPPRTPTPDPTPEATPVPAPATPDLLELRLRGDDEEPPGPPTPWSRRLLGLAREGALVLLALIGLWVGLGWLRAPTLPDAAPPFTLATLDGGQLSLESLRGKTVVLNFWATGCGPCQMEVPGLSAFARSHPDIPVLGIAVDGTRDSLRAAAIQLGIDYPVLLADAATKAAYKVTTLPTTVIVGPDGAIRSAHAGLMLQPHLFLLTR